MCGCPRADSLHAEPRRRQGSARERRFPAGAESFKDRLETIAKFVLISDDAASAEQAADSRWNANMKCCCCRGSPDYDFPDFDENTRATTFYTTGHHRPAERRLFQPPPARAAHAWRNGGARHLAPAQGRLHRDDVYMPITPMFHVHAWGFPYSATMAGLKQVYPGRYSPEACSNAQGREGVTLSHCVPTIFTCCSPIPQARRYDLSGWKVIIGGSALPTGLAEAALNRGIDIFAGYGMSETCPVLTLPRSRPDCSTARTTRLSTCGSKPGCRSRSSTCASSITT